MEIDRQGQGIFRTPQYIQNDPKYVKLAKEVIIDIQLNCKKYDNLVETNRKLINDRRHKDYLFNIHSDFKPTYIEMYAANGYYRELDQTKENLAISVSIEPTAEYINIMETSCEKKY